ncbi:hypothetical protein FJ936_13470 [Mesorhizobium sp. B2-4-13]|nr:hypothetical protein FJ936_13470 [Mesorhizobium sp. B2-4-13]
MKKRLPVAAWAMVLLSFPAGCTVAQSYRVSLAPGETAPGFARCSTEAGAYSLSMTTWQFQIFRYANSRPYLTNLKPVSHADSRFTYCLDYMANAFADDTLAVGYTAAADGNRTSTSGMLSYVASYAVDKSSVIVRKLIRAIFVVLSGDSDFNPREAIPSGATPEKLGAFEVDPLDAEEMAALNVRIKSFGFCLALDGYTYDTDTVRPQAYCDNPQKILGQSPSPALAKARQKRWFREKPDRGGILYRPRMPYGLSVYTRDDPNGPGPWELRETKTVYLENLSPIVSLDLNRVAFAKTRVGLEFDNGVLRNFCLARSGSVRGFIDIPLEIVYGVVALPSSTIKAEINRQNQSAELVDAQTKLLAAQRQFIAFEQSKANAKPTTTDKAAIVTGKTGCPSTGCVRDMKDDFPDNSGDAALPAVCKDIDGKLEP